MKKSFFLTYVSKLQPIKLVEIFEKKFDMNFIEHSSSYLGDYYAHQGVFCDSFKILNNILPDGEFEIDDSEIVTIMKLGFFNGKNKEKQSKTEYMKKQLDLMEDLKMYSYDVFDEN